MATFYIQLQDKLLKVNGDVTKENITNALGYVPSDFYGDFDELSNNPIITDETGVFNIVDETGNIIAKFDNKGIHTVEVSASGHNLTEKADKIYVDDEIRSINFDNLQNNPLYNDNIGNLKITDESGNTITVINSNGVESIEFTALESDGTTHHLTEKINKEDVHTILNNLDTSVKGTSSYVNVTVSQKNGLIDNVEVNDAVLSNTLVIEESGEFTIADEKGNIGLKLDNRGLISNEFIANGHMLSKKADTQYVDDKILTLDSQVSGTSVMHGITINVEEKNGLLSNVVIDDNNINFNKLKDNPIIEGETYGEFTIVDDTSLNSIGFVLNSSGAKAKDFITSTKVSLTDVGARIEQYSKIHDNLSGNILTIDERLSDIETLLQEDGDDVINNLKEVVDYFKDVKETETGAALLTTVATHTTNIEGLSDTVSTLNSKAVLKEGAQTITGRKTFTVGPNFTATGDTNAIAIGYDTRFNLLSGDTITDDTILGMISNKATLGHENYETQVRGKNISVGNNNSKTTIQGSDTKLTYNGKNLAFEEDTASKLKTLKFTYGISAGKTGTITYDGTKEEVLYIPTSIGHLNSNDTNTLKSEIIESAITFTTNQGYATQTWVNNKGYLTSSSLDGYAKTTDVNKKQDAISDLATIRSNASSGATAYGWGDHSKKGYLTSSSLNGYATETWVTKYVTSAVTGGQVSLDGYATENWVNSKNYLTSSSLDGYAKTTDVNKKQDAISDLTTIRNNASSGATAYGWGDHSKKGYLTSSSLNGYAKTSDVNKKQDAISDLATIRSNASSGATAYGWGDHSKKGYLTSSALSGYAKEDWVTSYVVSAVTGGQVSLDGYATENWVNSKNYLTSSSLDGYAKTTDVNKKQDAISDLATIRSNASSGATAYGWGDHSKKGYLTSSSLSGYAKTSDLASYLSKSGGQINGSLIINDESHNHITLTDDGEMYYDAKISYSDGTLGVYSGNRIDILSPISVKSKITVSNEYSGFTCTNLNADLLDGKHASEFMLKTDSVTGSVTYDDITDAPLIDNNDGEFHLVDENDYKIASFNNGGLFTTKVTAINGFFQNSDETLKEFKNDIEIDFERLKNIPKVYYTWKDDTEGNLQIGTSAQKVQEIYPELTSRDADSGKLALDYAKLSIIALKAIDTLHEENKLLRKELEELKEKVNTKRTRKKKTE